MRTAYVFSALILLLTEWKLTRYSQGPAEFVVVGSLKGWEGWRKAHDIKVETLLLNGRYDEVTDACMKPWFKTVPRVRWVTLENSSHMGHFEDRDRFMQVCGNFISDTAY